MAAFHEDHRGLTKRDPLLTSQDFGIPSALSSD
jgi:hypothetical protein